MELNTDPSRIATPYYSADATIPSGFITVLLNQYRNATPNNRESMEQSSLVILSVSRLQLKLFQNSFYSISQSALATSTQRDQPRSAKTCASAAVIGSSEESDTLSPNASNARSQRFV